MRVIVSDLLQEDAALMFAEDEQVLVLRDGLIVDEQVATRLTRLISAADCAPRLGAIDLRSVSA